jgi:hypothetical protein
MDGNVMRRLLTLALLGLGIVAVTAEPLGAQAADRSDVAIGVWVRRIKPSDDVGGARVTVTADGTRPARRVLQGDGEGMAYGEFRFKPGITSARLVVTPILPAGLHLVSGGCDRKRFGGAYTAAEPLDVPALGGSVQVDLRSRQSASCLFDLGPVSVPVTSTTQQRAPVQSPAPWPVVLVGAAILGGALGARRAAMPAARRSRREAGTSDGQIEGSES